MGQIKWNDKVKLVLSDVDETVADLYLPALPEMISELNKVLESGVAIFLISGHGLAGIQERITNHIKPELRNKLLIGHCCGAEVWGFTKEGNLKDRPYYSKYEEKMSPAQKEKWRRVVDQVVREFELIKYPTMPVQKFKEKAGSSPLAVMYEDRGPQITFEVVNGFDMTHEQAKDLEVMIPETHGLYDLRIPILERADVLFKEFGLPVVSRLAGVFALDFGIEGVSKTLAVKKVLEEEEILKSVGLSLDDVSEPEHLEIWADKFSTTFGGFDRYLSMAVGSKVRAIDFRPEDPKEFMTGYNVQVWDGKKHLHEGLLEYLQSRGK